MEQNIFWFGVVEDRMDPLALGRCRVRVLGLHNPDTSLLPTEDLPWAYPITPMITAGVSGIGHSPTGPVEGTWCVVIFRDSDHQQPLILGTLAGMPLAGNTAQLKQESKQAAVDNAINNNDKSPGSQMDNTGEKPPEKPPTEPYTGEGPGPICGLTAEQSNKLKADIGKFESGSNYSKVQSKSGNYIGKYQFGSGALEDQGYLKPGSLKKYGTSALQNPANWTGKDGISSKEDWLSNGPVQERAMDALMRNNGNSLCRQAGGEMSPEKGAGMVWVAHNQGLNAAGNFMKTGAHYQDDFGTSAATNYKKGVQSVTGKTTVELPTSENISKPPADSGNSDAIGNARFLAGASTPSQTSDNKGFKDPFNVYPKYKNEQDTNRLARAKQLRLTSLETKIKGAKTNIPFANIKGNSKVWGQPLSPYNAKYPFNHVYMSESGHLMEFDDTKDAQRINLEHRSGTFIEIDRNGTQVNKIVGNGYTIYDNDGFIAIDGNCVVSVGKAVSLFVAGDAHIEVMGNTNMHCEGELNIEAEKQISIKTEKDIDIKCQDFNLTCNQVNFKLESSFEVTAGSLIAGDAPSIKWNGGAANPTEAEPNFRMFSPKLKELESSSFQADSELANVEGMVGINYDSDLGSAGTGVPNGAKNDKGETIVKDETPKNEKVNENQVPTKLDCKMDENGNISNSTMLSTNVSAGKMAGAGSKGAGSIKGQHGRTAQQVGCNMQNVAVNVFEPVKEKYPEAQITSGLRGEWSSDSSKDGTPSQHEYGEAIDISFPGKSDEEIFERAQWIKQNVPHDQLIYEQLSSGTTIIHVSLKADPTANRGDLRHLVYNSSGGAQYPSGLVMRKKS